MFCTFALLFPFSCYWHKVHSNLVFVDHYGCKNVICFDNVNNLKTHVLPLMFLISRKFICCSCCHFESSIHVLLEELMNFYFLLHLKPLGASQMVLGMRNFIMPHIMGKIIKGLCSKWLVFLFCFL
jgi:hypothetical protein